MAANNNAPLPTDMVPLKNVWQCIASHVENSRDVVNMALSCHFFYHSTVPVLLKNKLPKLSRWVVLEPTFVHIEKILNAMFYDRTLLFAKADEVVDDIRHRVIRNKTLYQLAYGAGDDDLVRRMEAVFVHHCGEQAKTIIEQQRNEMLESKEEFEKNEAACLAQFEEILLPMIAVIDAEPLNGERDENNRIHLRPETLAAIEIFKIAIAKIQPKEINLGMHFRYSLMQAAYDIYSKLRVLWMDHYERCALYEDVVIAALQDYMPAFDAMQFSKGLKYQVNTSPPQACARSLTLDPNGKGHGENYYDVVRGASLDFVLPGCCVDIIVGERSGISRGCYMAIDRGRYFEPYIRTKQLTCSFMRPDQKPSSFCVIC